MRRFVVLVEELESRPQDAERVGALARYLREVGRQAGEGACEWLVVDVQAPPAQRPRRLTLAALARAAAALAERGGTPGWLFDAGRAASSEAAEAIALLLPWPQEDPRPSLATWLACWHAAAQTTDTVHRALAIAEAVATLDDPMSRRWAVRAVCGLAKPFVSPWQWQRAWGLAFEEDAHAVAWGWYRRHVVPDTVPRPHPFTSLPDAPSDQHAGLLDAWRRGEVDVEPRWNGLRVQIVRHDADVAIWQRRGGLLNHELPDALVHSPNWPLHSVVEAVLIDWPVGRSRHLVVIDWHRWSGEEGAAFSGSERRARSRARWPVHDDLEAAPPPVFSAVALPFSDSIHSLESSAISSRVRGWSGVVLRDRHAAAWVVRSPLHRVRAVLQYVPTEALAAAAGSARALAYVDCGFALWNRAPLSIDEQHAAMTAAMAGEFLAAPPSSESPGAPGVPGVASWSATAGLRLLSFARVPIVLPEDQLQRIHAWLRANVGRRFGEMHAVAPALVFELGFTRLRDSARHKIGVAPLGVRVLRWLPDAPAGTAQRVDELPPERAS